MPARGRRRRGGTIRRRLSQTSVELVQHFVHIVAKIRRLDQLDAVHSKELDLDSVPVMSAHSAHVP
eukprot:5853786-Pyramimonas_sp.AAC.1